jgi:hypothetical protein
MPVNYITDSIMDEEEMSHASNWSGPSVLSGPYPQLAGGRLPYGRFSSGQSVSSEGDISLKRDREREGRCSECGVQTHEFRTDPQTGQPRKLPLTVDNEVHRGRCLLCHPLTSTHLSRYQQSSRSINTVSSHGGNSVHSGGGQAYPDYVDSSGSVGSTGISSHISAVEEALLQFDNEACDLLDILTAMRRFPNERRIQERGCEKLWIQSWDDENSSAIGRVGGIHILLNAMANFSQSQRLQQSGCEALQNLALNDFNRDAIVENGGIRVIVNAMTNHREVVGVQQCGCTALANLAASPDNHLDIANAGGLHAIMNAAQNNQDEESVLRAAYQALRAMGYDPNRHGPGAQQAQQQQAHQATAQQQQAQQATAQQQQAQPQPQQQRQDVIRLDQHGFPIN